MSDFMNQELVDEIEYTKELLANSGFFNREDIIEILEEQFIEEDIDFSNIEISFSQKDNSNFKVLENAFIKLSKELNRLKLFIIIGISFPSIIEEGKINSIQ